MTDTHSVMEELVGKKIEYIGFWQEGNSVFAKIKVEDGPEIKLQVVEGVWVRKLRYIFKENGESFEDIVFNTISDDEMCELSLGFLDCPRSEEFAIWTKRYAYFPHECDGAESVRSIAIPQLRKTDFLTETHDPSGDGK